MMGIVLFVSVWLGAVSLCAEMLAKETKKKGNDNAND